MTLNIEVMPSVDFDKLEEVLVLIPTEAATASVSHLLSTPALAPALEKKL